MRQYQRDWYQRNKGAVKARSAAWQKAHPDKVAASGAKHRAAHPEQTRESWKRYQARNPELCIERMRQYAARHPARYLLRTVVSRARRLGVECSLTEAWISERLSLGCELSGIPFDLILRPKNSKRRIRGASVDRRAPGGPYSPENCRLICVGLNLSLQDFGFEEVAELWRITLAKAK